MNNITEGFGRINPKGSLKFYGYGQSSCLEVKSMLYVLKDIEYLTKTELVELHQEIDKTLNSTLDFIRHLRNRK